MEHRWSNRTPIDGKVTLTLRPGEKVQASIRDISIGGICLSTGDLTAFLDATVMLVFALQGDGEVSHHRVTAQVVHCTAQHTGLIFLEPGLETLRALRRVTGTHRGVPPVDVPEQLHPARAL
jgi:hypothetical protein